MIYITCLIILQFNLSNPIHESRVEINQTQNIDFIDLLELCLDFQLEQYYIDPYLYAAIFLQKTEQDKAVELLKKAAETYKYENQIIVLCRMLYKAKPDCEFRRPMIGGAAFLGNTDYRDWRNEPIEIVDGIPFLIVRGYSLGGEPESASHYISYCVDSCEWSDFIYKPASKEDMDSAYYQLTINIFIKTLSFDEYYFLKEQTYNCIIE